MARYIDADKFKSNLEKAMKKMHLIGGVKGVDVGAVIVALDRQPTADVVPKSEEGAECPTCHGTGRIGTTDWLTKNISKKQLAEEKAKAIAEHEQHIKAEVAREIFGDVKKAIKEEVLDYCRGFESMETPEMQEYYKTKQNTAIYLYMKIDQLEKKYTEGAADNGGEQ